MKPKPVERITRGPRPTGRALCNPPGRALRDRAEGLRDVRRRASATMASDDAYRESAAPPPGSDAAPRRC